MRWVFFAPCIALHLAQTSEAAAAVAMEPGAKGKGSYCEASTLRILLCDNVTLMQ